MRLSFFAVALSACALSLVSCSSEAGPEGGEFSERVVAELNEALRDTQARLGVPGMRAAIEAPGAGSWTGSVGVGDWSTGASIGERDHIRIGSVTKTFTVTTFLRLADQGVVGIDDPVGKFVSDVPNGDKITLRMLANMTSGLGSYTFVQSFQDKLFGDPNHVWKPTELLDIAFAETRARCPSKPDACFAPGTAFSYSNTNTVLLAVALERAAKRPYVDLLRENVIVPLGLADTFVPTDEKLPRPRARGFTSQGTEKGELNREATDWNPSWGWAVGDIVSTMHDMRIWARALGTGKLLSDAMKKERFTALTLPGHSPDHAYAVGIGVNKGWWGHTGELPGYNVVVYYRPDVDAVMVVVANHDLFDLQGKNLDPATYFAGVLVDIANREAPLGDFGASTPEGNLDRSDE